MTQNSTGGAQHLGVAERGPGSQVEQRPLGGDRVARLYLARHGRTPLNVAGVLRGRLDPPLDEVGRGEALRLGWALGGTGVRLVVASPLQRAVETARPVAERAGLEVETDPRLLDRDYGSWAGQPRQAVVERWGSLDGAPGVEPGAEVAERALEALAEIAERSGGAAAVAVSHDAVNRTVLSLLSPGLGDPDQVPQANGCYNVIERRGDTWSVLCVNKLPGDTGAP